MARNSELSSTIRRAAHEERIASTVMAEGKRSRREDRLSDGVKRKTTIIRKASIATVKPYDATLAQRAIENKRLNERPAPWQPLAAPKVTKAQQRRIDAQLAAERAADKAYWAAQQAKAPKAFVENELRDK